MRSIILNSADETAALAHAYAPHLRAGDVLFLFGEIGAGKTHFAREIIRARLDIPEDIPSPTYTLVQTYAAAGLEFWHADLYRLGHAQELVELGLADAFQSAVCLVEWPEILAASPPQRRLELRFATDTANPEQRRLDICSFGDEWDWVNHV